MAKSFIAEWAKSIKPVNRCSICKNRRIASAIAEFYALRKAGKTSASWSAFHAEVLVKRLGWAGSYCWMMTHVKHAEDCR